MKFLKETVHCVVANSRETYDELCNVYAALSLRVKWLTVGAGVVGVSYIIYRTHVAVSRVLEIDPYAEVSNIGIVRGFNRVLVDKTKKDLRFSWYPTQVEVDQSLRSSDNGHPLSGGARDRARRMINAAVLQIGREPMELSPAEASAQNERALILPYAVNDLYRDMNLTEPKPGDCIVGIDVDYYIPEDKMHDLFGRGNPGIFYTFNPTTVAGVDGESHFTIKNNRVSYDVSGGGEWNSWVWNWCSAGEFLRFRAPLETWYAKILRYVGIRKVVYTKVHHSRPWASAPHRALVWLIPQFSHWELYWVRQVLTSREIKYVDYQDKDRPGWNKLVSFVDNEKISSIGREGENLHLEIATVDLELIMGLKTSQSACSRMIGLGYTKPNQTALVGQYFEGRSSSSTPADEVMRPSLPKVHWPNASAADAPEVSARVYAKPIVTDENLMPMIKRWDTLSNSLERRVTFVRNTVVPTADIQRYAAEFVQLVVPDALVGVPYDLETTVEMLDKPSQRLGVASVWETIDMPCRALIESFVKNEPTNKAGRIISSFPDMRFLLCFSQYTLKFRDAVLHSERNRHWFCPGLTPSELADKVCGYCCETSQTVEGDFSNFDGSVSEWAQRNVMNAVYIRYFGNQYTESLRRYLDMLVSCPARAKKFNFAYEAGVGVKSGSPTTCDANSVLNAFTQYVAVRKTYPEIEPELAFGQIGLAFGDDSLFERKFKRQWNNTCRAIGIDLKIEENEPTRGVCFLARVFPSPHTTTTSFQDPLRTWRKLHLTTRDPNIPLASAATDRVTGYLVTDGLTPVTASYCRMVQRLYADTVEDVAIRNARKSVNNEKPYWLTGGEAWPQKSADVQLMKECVAARVGLTVEAIDLMEHSLDNLTDVWGVVPFDRREEDYPYKDTLDPDNGLPIGGSVDHRLFNHDVKVNNFRASHAGTRQGIAKPGTSKQVAEKSVAEGARRTSSESGTVQSPRVSQDRAGANRQVDQQSNGDAQRQRVPEVEARGATAKAHPGRGGRQFDKAVDRPKEPMSKRNVARQSQGKRPKPKTGAV